MTISHSNPDPVAEHRLVQLESSLAFQAKTVSDLEGAVNEQAVRIEQQQQRIDLLERAIRMLSEQLRASASTALPHEKPPHY